MMFTKTLHLQKLMEGVNFESKKGVKSNSIIDPTIIASITRNIYEFTSLFHLLFRKSKGEERQIIHNLWVRSGLKYRQQFIPFANTPESINKQKRKAKLL